MISADFPTHRFHLRAAAIVIDGDCVLLHRPEGDPVWALPGGRVDAGEEARACVQREFEEELGESVDCGDLVQVIENFFELRGRRYHELGLYFTARLRAGSRVLDKVRSHEGIEGDRRLEFRWFPLAQLARLELRPGALREALPRLAPGFVHIVHRDG
jgi:ADP-ribose pyrophosphatase YjhB (NUDIX family)